MTQHERITELKAEAAGYRDAGDLDAARERYEEAVELCRELEDPALLARTLRHLGDVHREAGELVEAGACYDEALPLYRDADMGPGDRADALRSAALLAEALNDVPRARAHWEEARVLYTAAEMDAGVMECDRHLEELAGTLREQLGFSYEEILASHLLLMSEEKAQEFADAIRDADISGPVVWMDPSLLALASLSDDAARRVVVEAPHLEDLVTRVREDPTELHGILDELAEGAGMAEGGPPVIEIGPDEGDGPPSE